MKWWALAKQFPKYALVFGTIVGSTVLFGFWWFFLRAKPNPPPKDNTAELAAIRERAAKAEARIDYLFLADDDLYDADTGECLFKNWLHGDHPVKLFYDQAARKIIGQYNEGFVHYAFDGSRDAVMMRPEPPAFVPGSKKIVFVKDKNIWQADLDWQSFKFVNERQVTTMGVFYEQHFADNVVLLTDKTLVVRNLNNLLRVNLENGNVKPGRLPLNDIGRRRSPDSKWLAGTQGNEFFCYDVDADTAKTIPVGRNGMSEIQWLGNNKCLGLAVGKTVVAYDRPNHTLTEVCTLPFSCFKMGEPSPDGRFIFCGGGINARNGVLVDLQKNTAVSVNGGAGIIWINIDMFLYSHDTLDSDLRGTWLQSFDKIEARISSEPLLVISAHHLADKTNATEQIALITQYGISILDIHTKKMTESVRKQHPAHTMRIEKSPW